DAEIFLAGKEQSTAAAQVIADDGVRLPAEKVDGRAGQGAEARLVTAADACPDVLVDGRRLPMQARAKPDADFPVTVCQALLPKEARRASLDGIALPLPPRAPKRIVIFGDTGCRLKGWDIQNCDNPADWPFARVAALAAAHHPDLVIHVGDYYYRESPCPAGRAGCSGSPWGDNWTTWDADFFRPARPLLRAAPWVMVRGNHEDCERGGPGWFHLLDGAWSAPACPATSAPMAIDLGGLDLYVLDSSGTSDGRAPPAKVAAFAAQLDLLRRDPPKAPVWILTHRPIWGLAPVAKLGPLGPLEVPINATEQAAARGRPLTGVQMVVSGHIHHFASFSFLGNRPAQLIVGTGGDVGSPADSPRYLSNVVTLDGMKARRFGFDRYGFLVLDRTATGWAGRFYDTAGRPVAACALAGQALACRPA
ncbi:MAG: metallophosphoesterase family protein, partial [Caulobacteraceae bacterium]